MSQCKNISWFLGHYEKWVGYLGGSFGNHGSFWPLQVKPHLFLLSIHSLDSCHEYQVRETWSLVKIGDIGVLVPGRNESQLLLYKRWPLCEETTNPFLKNVYFLIVLHIKYGKLLKLECTNMSIDENVGGELPLCSLCMLLLSCTKLRLDMQIILFGRFNFMSNLWMFFCVIFEFPASITTHQGQKDSTLHKVPWPCKLGFTLL